GAGSPLGGWRRRGKRGGGVHQQGGDTDREQGFLDVEAFQQVRHRREDEQPDGGAVGDAAMTGDAAAEEHERHPDQGGRPHGGVGDLGREGVAQDVEAAPELRGQRRRDVADAGPGDGQAQQTQATTHRCRTTDDPRDRGGPTPSHDFSPVLWSCPPRRSGWYPPAALTRLISYAASAPPAPATL